MLLTQLKAGISCISFVEVLCSVLSVLVRLLFLAIFFNNLNVYLEKAISITIY